MPTKAAKQATASANKRRKATKRLNARVAGSREGQFDFNARRKLAYARIVSRAKACGLPASGKYFEFFAEAYRNRWFKEKMLKDFAVHT